MGSRIMWLRSAKLAQEIKQTRVSLLEYHQILLIERAIEKEVHRMNDEHNQIGNEHLQLVIGAFRVVGTVEDESD